MHALWSWYHGLANPPLLSLSSTWKILISPEGGCERERENERGWANNDDCWLRFQPGIRETCRFSLLFFPFLGIYSVYHPSATHVFPQLMAAIVERIKDTFWCIRLVHRDVETFLIPLLISIIFSSSRSISRQTAFPSGRISMVGCNGTNWENFRISAATRIIKRDIRLQVKFEARIVNRDVKNESRIN